MRTTEIYPKQLLADVVLPDQPPIVAGVTGRTKIVVYVRTKCKRSMKDALAGYGAL